MYLATRTYRFNSRGPRAGKNLVQNRRLNRIQRTRQQMQRRPSWFLLPFSFIQLSNAHSLAASYVASLLSRDNFSSIPSSRPRYKLSRSFAPPKHDTLTHAGAAGSQGNWPGPDRPGSLRKHGPSRRRGPLRAGPRRGRRGSAAGGLKGSRVLPART